MTQEIAASHGLAPVPNLSEEILEEEPDKGLYSYIEIQFVGKENYQEDSNHMDLNRKDCENYIRRYLSETKQDVFFTRNDNLFLFRNK